MHLTAENYHSLEANKKYLSVSQYKSFLDCEARTLAELSGVYEREEKDAFLEGNYVHAWNEGKLPEFIAKHPEIISSKGPTKGELKAGFKKCDEMIETLERSKYARFVLAGEKEVPIIAEMFGTLWKGKIDSLNTVNGWFVDLKTAKSIHDPCWIEQEGKNIRVSFIEKYDYFIQFALYQEMERIASGRKHGLDPIMVVVTKEDSPDLQIIKLNDSERLKAELLKVEQNIPHILQVKSGSISPKRCELCKYCRSTKVIDKIISYTELIPT